MKKIAVIIPTKNRKKDLFKAIDAIKGQTLKPYEVVIVDQSQEPLKEDVEKRWIDLEDVRLNYVYNKTLSGLTAAKNLGVERSNSDILLFIDDDIVLNNDFIELLVLAFKKYPEIDGFGGVGQLPRSKMGKIRRYVALWFQKGPFHDKRAIILEGCMSDREIVKTWWLSGGLSSVRKKVFDEFCFDESLTGASLVEDFDFYWRASKKHQFAILPNARAMHNMSEVNRGSLQRVFAGKVDAFAYIYGHYLEKSTKNHISYLWRNVGFFIDACVFSIVHMSLQPLKGLFIAINKHRELFLKRVK